ncbi:9638_t:CDS:2 [Funneliformis mosseae]|uniref:9638_t:CDS:1 n=1 Tax=Funneliformis mosseae TaxID=27381 RepID=A0A9N9BNN1_FUNMO|nr:9638_t:CDS:2 [Funneliformis mosseae]
MFQEIGAKNQILIITTTKHFIIRQEGTIEEVTPENILFGQVDKPVIQLPSPVEQRPTNNNKYLISDLRRKSMKTIWESLTDEKVIKSSQMNDPGADEILKLVPDPFEN